MSSSSLLGFILRQTDEPPEGWERPHPDDLPTTGNLPLWKRRRNHLYNMELRKERAEAAEVARRREAEAEAGLKQNTTANTAATTDQGSEQICHTDKDGTGTENPMKLQKQNVPEDNDSVPAGPPVQKTSGRPRGDRLVAGPVTGREACAAHQREACPARSDEERPRKRHRHPSITD
jgi:hypothetical protein